MKRSFWRSFLHLTAYVVQGVAGLMLGFVVLLWLLRGFQAPIPEFIPDAALEPLTMILGAIAAFAAGRVAAWSVERSDHDTSPAQRKRSTPLRSPSQADVNSKKQGTSMSNNTYSCFISYSSRDDDFAQKLHMHLQCANIDVWFAPADMKGGQKLIDQIGQAIRAQDKLLLVLSPNSMQSEWVATEIRKARQVELTTKQRKLFPISLVDFTTIRQWELFNADTGKDLAVEVREFFIPDFSDWKDDAKFQDAFARLLNDLQHTA